MRGDGFRVQHDSFKWLLDHYARRYGVEITTEVYGLFAAHIAQLDRWNSLPVRKRQGIVADFMVRILRLRKLNELKMLHVGSSTYTLQSRGPERCKAVAKRAARVHPRVRAQGPESRPRVQ